MKRKHIIIAFICAAFLMPIIVCAVMFYSTDTMDFEFYKMTVQIDDTIVVIEQYVRSTKSPIVTVQRRSKVHTVYFSDVISNKEWEEKKYCVFDIGGNFWTKNTLSSNDEKIRYNDHFLWLQAFNGRYVIIDLVNVDAFITPSYFQCVLIILITVSIIIMNITIFIYRKNKST